MMALLVGWLPQILGGLAAIAALVGIYLGVKHSGVQEQVARDNAVTLRDVENRNDVASKVASEPDTAVADDLRKHWTK